jgi:signal transduction histidine kinase
MKKTTIILLLVLQLFLMLIFQNIYSLFKGFENVDLRQIKNPLQLMNDIKRIRSIFSLLFIITSLLFVGSAVYLGVLFKKSRLRSEEKGIPPLHDYLLELKGSETELKNLVEKQQAHVLEKEELNKNIINNINSAVIFINRTGRIDIFNAVAQQLFSQGYANAKNNLPEKILGKFPGIVEFVQANEGRKVSSELTSNDRAFWVDLNPLGNIGQLLMVKDITEEKKREAIDRSNSNFIMLGEMTAFLAHEVRNSLGVIYGYSKTIKTDQEKIRKVNKEIHFLTAMMESFLAFSKPVEVQKQEVIDLAELLAKIAGENGLALETNREKINLDSDPSLLRPVFSNLLLNSKEAGANRVGVSFKPKKNNDLEILLKDNGKGIAGDVKEKIWYPFFTTKEKGTGMGLAVIRKIINTLRGEISLVETGPQGTTFKIVFYH